MYLRQTASSAEINYFNDFALIRSPTENLSPRQPVTTLANFNAPANPDFVRNGTQMQLVLRVNPTPSTNQFLLVSKKNSLSFTAFDEIAVASFSNPSNLTKLTTCSGLDCDVIDAEFVAGKAQIVYYDNAPDGRDSVAFVLFWEERCDQRQRTSRTFGRNLRGDSSLARRPDAASRAPKDTNKHD